MHGKIVKINENSYRIENEFVYYYLLVGDNQALMIDSGVIDENVKEIAKSITSLPVTLVNTHGDMDHAMGNKYFDEFYISKADYDRCELSKSIPNVRYHDLKDGQVFDLGKRVLRVIEIPGHTYGSVALLDETNRWLFSGDTVSDAIIYMFGKHRCPEKYPKSLKKLCEMEDKYDVIFPAHGTTKLKSGYASLVLEDWNKVLSGEAESIREEIHGTMVNTYRLKACGFYV